MRHLLWLLGLCLPLAVLAAGKAPVDRARRYEERLKAVKQEDPGSWIALADFCEQWTLLDKREEALEKAVSLDPGCAAARVRLDQRLLDGEWLSADRADAAEAQALEAEGKVFYGAAWIDAEEAGKQRALDRKEIGWDAGFRIDTPRLRIYTDAPLGVGRRLAAILENEIETYRRFHPKGFCPEKSLADLASRKLKVFLCWDPQTFRKVAGPVWIANGGRSMSPDIGGFYDPKTRVLYVSHNPEDASLRLLTLTAVHELFHGLDDVLGGITPAKIPRWLVEGRACHFGWAVRGRQVLPGHVQFAELEAYPDVIEQMGRTARLGDLVRMDKNAFGASPANYIASWALTHFLFHAEEGRHAEGFRRFLSGLPAGKGSKRDLDQAVGDLAKLEAPFRAYVLDVLVPAAQASRGNPP